LKREFHKKARTGKTRVWTIELDGKFIHTTFGELGGAMQRVTDEGQAKNTGRANEMSPEEDAQNMFDRLILKKTRGGYRPAGEEEAAQGFSWEDKVLPENMRFYKPANTLSKHLEKKVNDGSAWLGWKRDGEAMVLVKWPDGSVDIVARTMLPNHHLEKGTYTWNDRFPHIVEEAERREDIPPRSILLVEATADPRERLRGAVASFMRDPTPAALRKPPLFFYCWDVAWWEGEPLLEDVSTRERYEIIWELFADPVTRGWNGKSWFLPVEVFEPGQVRRHVEALRDDDDPRVENNIDAAMLYSKKLGWEGWVVVDPDQALGNKGVNFRGKTDRPSKASGKLKPVYEDDFIALFDPDEEKPNKFGKWGRGKYRRQVGSVTLFQFNAAGELTYICECGGGIDDDFRAKYSDPEVYPLVVEVEFNDRTYMSKGEKTNALQFPRIVRVRTDKTTDECVNEEL